VVNTLQEQLITVKTRVRVLAELLLLLGIPQGCTVKTASAS
jgi:hypothetical protein